MKKLILLILLIVPLLGGCGLNNNNVISADSYFRIHIRANSNLEIDQSIKYIVKDEVVNYLTPKIANCKTKNDVICLVNIENYNLKMLIEEELKNSGYNYGANIKIKQEYFPTRAYGNYVLDADFYDALIIELGSAMGENWWCVVYPPLCFLNNKEIDTSNIKYKSFLYDLINKFFG